MNTMTRIALLLYMFSTVSAVEAQVVYYVTQSKQLRYLELSTCTDTLIMNVLNPANPIGDSPNDCAIGPDGTFYVVFGVGSELFKADPVSGQLTYLTAFSNVVSGLVCDAQGVVWAGGFGLHSYDPAMNSTINYGDFDWFAGQTVGGDLTFRDGNLYMIDALNRIRKVDIQNPINSTIVFDLSASGLDATFGLFSVYYSCDSISTYTSGSLPGIGTKIAKVNFDNGSLSILNCDFPFGNFIQFYGASTPLEYLGSIPCVQTFDLDGDNSSGPGGSDYAAPVSVCAQDSLPIADLDAQLLYYKNIDSVQVYLISMPIPDPGNEQLLTGGTGLLSLGNGSTQLTLVGQPSAPDSIFRKALLKTVYLNTATIPTPGLRTVRVVPWSGGIALDTALAYLQISNTPTSTLLARTCPGTPFMYQGVGLQVGQSQSFTLTNYLGCDSVVTVTVAALPVSTGTLLARTCPSEPFVYQGVSLQAGQSQTFTLVNYLGCDSVVTVTVSALPSADFDLIAQASCPNLPNGSITIQLSTGGTPPFRFSLNGMDFQAETRFDNLSPGSYAVYLLDQNDCQFEGNATVNSLDPLEVVLPDALLSCDSGRVILRPVVGDHLVNLQYKWSGGQTTASVTVQEAGPIWVEVSNVCQTVRQEATISWLKNSDIAWVYVPNIISPTAQDVVNQVFHPFFAAEAIILSYHFEVYDRWGNLLFESEQPEQGWAGPRHDGVGSDNAFVWQLKAELSLCGSIQILHKSGEVTVWGR